jgi:uncharacterized protein YqhQ
MAEEKLRLGGMALPNGVLVHGQTSWACAVRLPGGGLKVATGAKRFRASNVERPLLRGPARIVELFALLPQVRRSVPEARLPFERREVLAGMVASAAGLRLVRGSKHFGPVAQELVSSVLSIAPAALALRSSELAAYHGAEHVSIGTYEHGERRDKEHERCGGHLVGPLIVTNAVGNAIANRVPGRLRSPARAAAALGALAASTEMFLWMTKNPEHRLSKLLGRPGHELQHRLSTSEPTSEQLEVAEAALQACLVLERAEIASAA